MQEQGDRLGDFAHTLQQIDLKFQQTNQNIDQKFLHLDGKIDGLRNEMASQFRWIVGLLLSFGVAILTAVLGVLAAVLKH